MVSRRSILSSSPYETCPLVRYRPPELLLGERDYGPAIDMWGTYPFVFRNRFLIGDDC